MNTAMDKPIKYLIGIDAGGTKCAARLCLFTGELLSEGRSAPAALSQQKEQALQVILELVVQLFHRANLPKSDMQHAAIAIGISGIELASNTLLMENWRHPFRLLAYSNDANIANLGAHLGDYGTILSVGTGIVAWEHNQNGSKMRFGWGFPLGDIGSGSWLGLRAIQETIKAEEDIINIPVRIEYLDSLNNKYIITKTLTKELIKKESIEPKKSSKWWIILILILAIGYYIYRRKRR